MQSAPASLNWCLKALRVNFVKRMRINQVSPIFALSNFFSVMAD
jgi:hypothetical protein